LALSHLLLVEHFLVVVMLNDERVPVISRQTKLRVAELIGRGAAYSGNPHLCAKNWLILVIKDPQLAATTL
jgi:hypothetical protein